jgi:translation initiation factor IF-2
VIPDVITVQELSQRMATRAVDVIKFMMRQGMMLKINDVIDSDTAELIATEFGHNVTRVSESDVETGFLSAEDHDQDTVSRPPVVAVMGHVDHGKTSLLDALRSADVAGGEHGGITQHIGAYQVRLPAGDRVTFLDTPGHAAFSAMRARGANVTDIVVLVVAGDDGVMPQTIEAIHHAKAAGAPIIVAVNKMDKPGSDVTRVINELLQHEIVVESLGGDTQIIEVSALKKTGLDKLIEAILIQAEMMDLKANPDRTAEGVVIEGKLDKGRGPVATVLVKRGSLKRGDIVVAGAAWGRVRALINERDEQVLVAEPSVPVEILGLDMPPSPGEAFAVVENEARARELTEYRDRKRRDKMLTPTAAGATLADMMAKLQDKKLKELALIVKADVQGSAEAIIGSLEKISTDEVRARIIHSGVGAINESDVLLAKGSGSPILGFNVRASKQARDLAEREGVEIRYYAIIYDLLDDIKNVLSGMLSPIQRETFLGNADVLQAFDISKVGKIAGCRVSEGVVRKGAKVRIIRNDVVVLELGTLQTLKRFKDEVNEVNAGQECGMAFAGFQDIKAGDVIECFTVETIKRSL